MPRSPIGFQADVLLVFDTDCFYYLGANAKADPLTDNCAVNGVSASAFHSGAALNMVHLGDLKLVDWKKYRAVVFANTFLLTPEQKKFIRERVARDGRHLVWLYAPGYTDGRTLNTQFISEVVGMTIRPAEWTSTPDVSVESRRRPEPSIWDASRSRAVFRNRGRHGRDRRKHGKLRCERTRVIRAPKLSLPGTPAYRSIIPTCGGTSSARAGEHL